MFKQFDEYNSQLFEQCPIGLALCRTDGTLIHLNPAYAAILGRTVPETLNLSYWQITPEKYAVADQAILENLKQTGRYGPYEKELIHKDGHLVPVRISGLIIEKNGERMIWSNVEDMSDLRRAQQEREYTEQILKQSEARYRSLITASTQIVWVCTADGICFELTSWIAYTGQSLAEAENGGWIDAVHPDDRDRTAQVWSAAVATRVLYQTEYRLRGKDGSYRHFSVCGAPVLEEDGSVREWIGTCTDIHDRKLAKAQKQYIEQRYLSLVTATSQMVWTASPEGMVSSEIVGWEAYTGQSAAEMMGWGWLDVMHPDDRAYSAEVWSAAVANRSLYQIEYRIRAQDGTYRHFFGNAVPVLEADGSIREWVGTCTDIHDRKLGEQTLQRSEQRFRSLVTASSQIVWVATPEGLAVSHEMPTWIAYTGQSAAEVEGWGWLDPIHPDDRTHTALAWSTAVANQSLFQTEYRLRAKDGSYRYFAICGAPVMETDGSIREWIGTCTDIHDRKLTEAENQRLLDMLNHSTDAVIVRDFEDNITHWSQGAERLYGWSSEEVKNQLITHNLLHTIFPKPLNEIQAECLQQGIWEGELQHTTRDGRYVIVQSRWTMQLDAFGKPCATLEINTDITARKQAEIALRQLNQKLEARVLERTAALQNTLAEAQGLNAILDNLADGLLVVDTTGQITHFNPAFLGMYELTEVSVNCHYLELPISGLADLVTRTQSHPGEVFSAEVTLTNERIGQAVATAIFKKTVDQEPPTCFGSALLIRDVTAEKEIDKMKTDFISTVSHELRTPLTSVLGFASIIKEKLETDVFPIISTEDRKLQKTIKRVADNLNIIVSEAERLTSLINDVLDIAKMEAGKVEWQMQPIDPSELLDWAANSTAGLFETNGLQLVSEIEPGLPQIVGDRNRLLQVLINLISNAVKFTESGCVTCRVKQEDEGVCISIIDTGIGIAPEDQPKVFEKFRQVGDTLTDKPKGTGLGLPICKQIIDHHGGRIWVESERGKGSVFSFIIPTYASDPKTTVNLNLDTLVKQLKEHVITTKTVLDENRKTILVVDDDANIRELLRQQLENEGYNVREGKDGVDAIHQIKTARPDLILLDVMMPQINGFDVAAVLKNDPQTADIPIIILSIIENKERGYHIGIDRYLTKPINTEKLLSEIGSLLYQGTSSKKVLVVDKNASALKTLSDVLQAQGYNVIEASNPQECINKALSAKPDMIIIDSIFSQEGDLVKTLRFEKELENVFFIMLSDQ